MFVSSLSRSSGMVNAAFLQEVKESNAEVWHSLHAVRAIAEGVQDRVPNADVAHEFVRQLDALLDGIATEFSLEETLGFVGGVAVGSAAPDSDLAKSACQHRELFLTLQEVVEQAEEVQYRGTVVRDCPALLAEFHTFDSALRKHEEFEAELIRMHLGKNAF
ncbi:MAG: hypothetical protein Aurels2KO_54310 [Aureliella sp.]